MCTNLFRGTVLQQLLFGIQLAREEFQHPTIHTKIVQSVGGFFHQIKVCQTIGRKDSIQTMIGTSGAWIHFCRKRLRTLKSFKYSELNFRGLSNGTNIMQIQSGWMVPLIHV
jgi:hypothetical protein